MEGQGARARGRVEEGGVTVGYELSGHWSALPVEFPMSVEELYDLAMRLPDGSEVMVEADAWRRVQLKARMNPRS